MNNLLEIKEITKVFGEGTVNEKVALNSVSLTLREGDFVTVIGNNGAGKSTLLNCIAGVYNIDKGSIVLDGKDITKLPEHKRARWMGRVFQDPLKGTAFDMTIEENLAIAYYKNKSRGLSPGITSKDREVFREKLSMLIAFNPRITETIPQPDYQTLVTAVLKQSVGTVAKKQMGYVFLICKPKNGLKLFFIFNLNQSHGFAAGPEGSVFRHIRVFYNPELMIDDEKPAVFPLSVIKIFRHVIFYLLEKLRQLPY